MGMPDITETKPADDRRSKWIGIYIGVPMFYGHGHHWHCHYKKVKVWNKHHTKKIWVTKKTYCHRAWH